MTVRQPTADVGDPDAAASAEDPGPVGDVGPSEDLVAGLSHELVRHARLLHAMRARMATWAPAGLDWSAFALLMSLVKHGPARQGSLAEHSLLDPSTVSRYVGQLVRTGLVERRPDPADGRAVQVVASDRGLALASETIGRRDDMVRRALGGWDPDDLRTLARLFARMYDDLDAYRPHLAVPDAVRPDPAGPGAVRPSHPSTDQEN